MPSRNPNPLEMWCSDGFGITEKFEMAWTVQSNGVATSYTQTDGPFLSPYLPGDLRTQLSPTEPMGPVPVVVAGHFNDADATNCAPDVRDACRKTFVVESILAYDPSSAPTLPPTPAATLIPSSAAGLFEATRCSGDVPYSFLGWTTANALDTPMDFRGQAWAAVTQDVVPLGDWYPDANVTGHFSLAMGRRVCLAFPMDGADGGVTYTVVKGTAFRVWDDGRRTGTDEMGDGSGDPHYPALGPAPALPEVVTVSMHGKNLPSLLATIRDWSGELVDARPATDEEMALRGSTTGNGMNASALLLPDDPRSVLVVMAECGSDPSVAVTVTSDRRVILLVAAPRTDCSNPGARRGAVLSFDSDLPLDITAYTGL